MSTERGVIRWLPVPCGLAAGLLGLGACGDGGASAEKNLERPPDISITGTDQLTFEPASFEIPAGEGIVQLTSEKGVEHDLTIADVSGNDDLLVVSAAAGQTARATLTIEEQGVYEVYCSVPGHRQAGMTATLTVTDAG